MTSATQRLANLAANILATMLVCVSLCAFVVWLFSGRSSAEICSTQRDDGFRVWVTHLGANGETQANMDYRTQMFTVSQTPKLAFSIGSLMLREDGKSSGGIGSEYSEVQAVQSFQKGGKPILEEPAYFSHSGSPGKFSEINGGMFPFDRQILLLNATADFNTPDGRRVSIEAPDMVCIKAAPTFRASVPERLAEPNRSVLYTLTITRQPWYILIVFCAVLIVWVPVVVALKNGATHGPLELIATLTYAAAIRYFLINDSEPFSRVLLDVLIFLPILVLAVMSLVAGTQRGNPKGTQRGSASNIF